MRTRSSLAAAVVAAAALGCYEAPPPKEAKPGVTAESLEGKLRHRAVLTMFQSSFTDPSLRVIQYPEDYDEMWRAGFSSQKGYTKPFVNFDTEMVILVAAGTKPRSGYQIKVDSIVAGADLAVYVSETAPSPTCKPLNRITAPVQIVTIPWMEKTARFIERRTVGTFC